MKRASYQPKISLFLRLCLICCALQAHANLLLGCSEETTAPNLLPVAPQTAKVNQQLTVELQVNNPSGLDLGYAFQAPSIPEIERHAFISGDGRGGRMQYTPLVSHVGTHEFIFIISSSAGDSQQSALVTVSPAASDAPIFLEPIPGSGGVYDINRSPCVQFNIEVRDDDTDSVAIRAHETLPASATLAKQGEKSAQFDWCPTAEQVATARTWTISLEADDGEHPVVVLRYTVTLRGGSGTNCPGEAPVIAVLEPSEGARIGGEAGYQVRATVTDDRALGGPPLLLHTTTSQEDPNAPDLSQFTALTMTSGGGAGEWIGVIPPLTLAEGQEQIIYYLISATDDDDPASTSCDHTVESALRQLTATTEAGAKAQQCGLCASDSGCASGLCVQGESRKACLEPCGANDTCTNGSCLDTNTVGGTAARVCGPVESACAAPTCDNDDAEPNESIMDAIPIGASAQAQGVICPADRDLFVIDAASGGPVRLALTSPDAALSVGIYNADGELLCYSDANQVEACVPAAEPILAMVYSSDPARTGDYTLARSAGAAATCCPGDTNEPNNRLSTATPITADFDGALCPCDGDFFTFSASANDPLVVSLVLDPAEVAEMALYGADGQWIKSAYADGSSDLLELTEVLPTSGDYTIGLFGFGSQTIDYIGSIQLGGCLSTLNCPMTEVCNNGECTSDLCGGATLCPAQHACIEDAFGFGICTAPCSTSGDCRAEEACKWFTDGRGCGRRGDGANGDPCLSHEECGGQRACMLDWPDGYCARLSCASNADCQEADVFCASPPEAAPLSLCVRRCGGTNGDCRTGYTCASITAQDGSAQLGCVPNP